LNVVKNSTKGRSRKWKIVGVFFFTAAILGAILVWNVGSILTDPEQSTIGDPPHGLPAESAEFSSTSGSMIHGWLVTAQPSKGVVVLMHGIRSNRQVMIPRAEWLYQEGYSVLLFDFQGHGESLGKHITAGYLESRDATAAVNFVREKFPGQKVAVIGISMGAAAAVLAEPPLRVDAMVLESCYPTIYQAVADRLGMPGRLATLLLTWQLRPRLGFGEDDLCPIRQVAKLTVPKFFIAGMIDRDTTAEEAQALYDAAAEPKQLWMVDNAAHVDMLAVAGAEYKKRVLEFLAAHLN
jgi:pimeloyl-ACP methyl ester carboxylesterase